MINIINQVLLRKLVLVSAIMLMSGKLYADIIHLKTGVTIQGKVINETETHLKVKTGQGIEFTFEKSQIESIEKDEDVYSRRAKEVKDDDAKGHYELALWCKEKNFPQYAKGELQKAIEINRTYREARFELARMLIEEGDIYEAIGHLKEIKKSNPGDIEAKNWISWILERWPEVEYYVKDEPPKTIRLTVAEDYGEAKGFTLPEIRTAAKILLEAAGLEVVEGEDKQFDATLHIEVKGEPKGESYGLGGMRIRAGYFAAEIKGKIVIKKAAEEYTGLFEGYVAPPHSIDINQKMPKDPKDAPFLGAFQCSGFVSCLSRLMFTTWGIGETKILMTALKDKILKWEAAARLQEMSKPDFRPAVIGIVKNKKHQGEEIIERGALNISIISLDERWKKERWDETQEIYAGLIDEDSDVQKKSLEGSQITTNFFDPKKREDLIAALRKAENAHFTRLEIQFKDPKTIEALLDALKDEGWKVRVPVAQTLGNIFLAVRRAERVYQRKLQIEFNETKIMEALCDVVKQCPERNYLISLVQVFGNIKDPRAVKCLEYCLRSGDEFVRRSATRALAKIKHPSAAVALCTALRDKDVEVPKIAAEALGKMKDAIIVEPLIAILKDEDSFARQRAVVLLGYSQDLRAVTPLVDALKDNDYHVREGVGEALTRIGKPAVGPLITALKDENWHVRAIAAKALGRIGDPTAGEYLASVLKDESNDIRVQTEAQRALDALAREPQDNTEKVMRRRIGTGMPQITK